MVDQYIHFVTTGGTIDKDYHTRRGTRDFAIEDPAVERILKTVSIARRAKTTARSAN